MAEEERNNLQNLTIELIIIETRQALRSIGDYAQALAEHDRFKNVLREEWGEAEKKLSSILKTE